MNPFSFLLNWLKNAVKIKGHQLKGAPGVKTDAEAEALANHINAITPGLIDAEAAKHGVTVVPTDPTTPPAS